MSSMTPPPVQPPPVGVRKLKMSELGVTGLSRWGGFVDEEFLPQLKGDKAIKVYREMADNDAVIGSIVFAIDMLLRQAQWRVEPGGPTYEDQAAAEFVEQCMEDMCYDDQTEVLTHRGWVLFRDLTDDDLVAQRAEDGRLEYVVPKARHVYEFDGELLGNAGDAVDFLVSPNHRMLFAPRTGRKHDVSQKYNLGIHKAKDIYNRPGWVSKHVLWEGKRTGHDKDWLEFLGFCLADGSTATGRTVVLVQKETSYVNDLLVRCGLSERAKKRQVNGSTQWVIHDAALSRQLSEQFGRTSREKRLPQWLKDATPGEMECFLRGFTEGDGSEHDSGLVALYTSSKCLADDLQEVAMKAGYATTLLTRDGTENSFAPGVTNYRVSLWAREEALRPYLKTGRNWYKQSYKGNIYCVSVPSGVIMVRRNGKPMWSGNSHSWEEFISEVMSMLVYGFSWHEVVYKRRLGDSRNPMLRSKYTDGRIAWRKMPIRSQDTLLEWEFKESDGGIEGMWQMAPPNFERTYIPITKSMLFRTTQHKGNPQGRSVLRSAYRSWYFLKRLQEVEGIGIERDLAGLPMGRIPSEYLLELHKGEDADEEKLAVAKGWLDLVRNTKRDEQEGILIPSDIDEESGLRLWEFELLSTGGTRQVDTDKVVARYEQRIAMTVLADFILLGHEKVGSYALSTSKTGMFRTALNAWLASIASVLNEHELPRLFELNGWNLKNLPKFVPEEIESPPLDELGNYIKALSGSGMQLFPDDELENALRSFGKLPEKSEEAMLEQEERRADPLGQLGLNPEQNNGQPGDPAKLNPFAEKGATGLPFGNGKVEE